MSSPLRVLSPSRFPCFVLCFAVICSSSARDVLPFANMDHNPYVRQTLCYKRVSIPHFLLRDYSLPGNALMDPEKCPPLVVYGSRNSEIMDATQKTDSRLPRSLLPIHYLIKICPNAKNALDFEGYVEIELQVMETTNVIVLNAIAIKVESISIWLHRPKPEEKKWSFNPNTNNILTRRKNSKFRNFKKYSNNINDTTKMKKLPYKRRGEDRKRILKLVEENEGKFDRLTITLIKLNPILQRIYIYTKEQLKRKNTYKMKIIYKGWTSSKLIGLFRISHMDQDNKVRTSLVTQFQVSEARRVFPSFDEPGFKSQFTITLCRNKRHRTISNMPKVATIPKKDDSEAVWDLFKTSVPMATYFVAFAILDDYISVECNQSFIPFRVWAPSHKRNLTKFACDVSPPLLEFFEKYFEIPYPLPKMDLLATRQHFALGMENWGLVTFIYDRLLVDYDSPTTMAEQEDALVTISHEMAHQWFGNLVTPSWWSSLWLNEGFATYLSILGVDYLHPAWEKMKSYIVEAMHKVLGNDSMESSHPVVIPVSNPTDFFALFDEISYTKGCFLIRMMMHMLTEKAFKEGLRLYLTEMRFRSATENDLWSILTSAGHDAGTLWRNLTIADIMNTWIFQEGYPLVSVKKLSNGDLAVMQQRYYLEPDENEIANQYSKTLMGSQAPKWWIPLSIVDQSQANMSDTLPKFWMYSHEHVIHSSKPLERNEWFLLNVQQTGFFRTNYERENWLQLASQMNRDHTVFDEMTRAQLIDDSFSLAYSGVILFDIPLELISYMKKETSLHVVATALNKLHPYVHLFAYDSLYGDFKNLIVETMSSHYPSEGVLNRPAKQIPHVRKTQNHLIEIICKEFDPCIQESKIVFEEWLRNPSNNSIVDEDILNTMLCTAVYEEGEKSWDKAFDIIMNPEAKEISDKISILACSKHMWLDSRLLIRLLTDESSILSKIYIPYALKSIASKPPSFNLAWQYIVSTWEKTGILYKQLYFEAVVPSVWSKTQFSQVIRFVSSWEMGRAGMSQSYVQEIMRNIERKFNFKERSYEAIYKWFHQRRMKG